SIKGFNFNDFNNKKIADTDDKKFQQLVQEVTKDGIVTPSEKEKIWQAGFEVKDASEFQDLKQGIPTEFEDISKAFSEGYEAAKSADSIKNKASFNGLVKGSSMYHSEANKSSWQKFSNSL